MCDNVIKASKVSIMGTLISVAISSFSLSLIPLASDTVQGKSNALSYIIAAVFWVGLLSTFVGAFYTKRLLRGHREKMVINGQLDVKQPVGIISFSKDWRMWVIYGITVVGLILIITDIIFSYVPSAVMFPIISFTILSFAVHCVVDGKYYKTFKVIKENCKR